jgi:hypothetical protein
VLVSTITATDPKGTVLESRKGSNVAVDESGKATEYGSECETPTLLRE